MELIVGHVGAPKTEGNGQVVLTPAPGTIPPEGAAPEGSAVGGDPKRVKAKGGTAVAAIIKCNVEINVGNWRMEFNVAAAIMKSDSGLISCFMYGQMDYENFSIGQMLGDGTMKDDHHMNLTLSRVAIVACSSDLVDDYGLNAVKFPNKKGKP